MKEYEAELNISISIPFFTVISYLVIVSIVMVCLSALNNFSNITSVPVSALGSTVGFIIFNLIISLFKNK
ncbi:hypothetical protein EPL77_14045 [Clostridioides difficile]|uniref:hypothetical protein n=1 Tax=Clostridioides difficile TaxID=1496 RepID=UPI00094326F3|nr:hypothetical protein [Clostridioides difficile]EGT2232439.1 hypothetical protein [Clostridioides difficile]EGT4167200.1 hypothetical protein [Clostridioides difficile]EGT5104299.1 hypothetical protein [Clostridioides difficile]MBH6939181.1 hypothetical protein [Clostridioides difficile]MBH7794532.1 hypothetical protein [Clostridioides difficile]